MAVKSNQDLILAASAIRFAWVIGMSFGSPVVPDVCKMIAIASELDELPLPYHYDVKPYDSIKLRSLREHIDRVGIQLYP